MKTSVIPIIVSQTSPTSSEDISAGYPLGQWWFNSLTGEAFVHKSDGFWESKYAFGNSNDFSTLDETGIHLVGGATQWDDDNFDPTMLTGGGNLPSRITFASTGIGIAAFSGSQVDEVESCREIPHGAQLNVGSGTDVKLSFHAHTYATTAVVGNVRLGLEYFFTIEGVAVTTSTIIYKTYTTNGIAWAKQSVNFDDITVPNELGSQFHWRFFRAGNDVLDTYNSNVAISTIGYHYKIDSLGSDEMLVK
jgi:hypothetical protein